MPLSTLTWSVCIGVCVRVCVDVSVCGLQLNGRSDISAVSNTISLPFLPLRVLFSLQYSPLDHTPLYVQL